MKRLVVAASVLLAAAPALAWWEIEAQADAIVCVTLDGLRRSAPAMTSEQLPGIGCARLARACQVLLVEPTTLDDRFLHAEVDSSIVWIRQRDVTILH